MDNDHGKCYTLIIFNRSLRIVLRASQLMQRQKPEIQQGDAQLRYYLLLFAGVYVLFLIWLNPLLDFLLRLDPELASPMALEELNQYKKTLGAVISGMVLGLPLMYAMYFGWRVYASARMPPARMRFPFTVPVIKSMQARMFGALIIFVSLVVLSQLLIHIAMQVSAA